jgi:hypothetical protein
MAGGLLLDCTERQLQCVRVTVTTMSARPGFRSSDTAAGYELWGLCNDHLLFHQSPMRDRFFAPCYVGTKCKGTAMSILIPDNKVDDWARDCVVRLANRVDDEKLRERLLQMAREWKPAAIDAGNRSSAVT